MIFPVGLAVWGFVVGVLIDRADENARNAMRHAERNERSVKYAHEDVRLLKAFIQGVNSARRGPQGCEVEDDVAKGTTA